MGSHNAKAAHSPTSWWEKRFTILLRSILRTPRRAQQTNSDLLNSTLTQPQRLPATEEESAQERHANSWERLLHHEHCHSPDRLEPACLATDCESCISRETEMRIPFRGRPWELGYASQRVASWHCLSSLMVACRNRQFLPHLGCEK